ncbi:four helix bundle protein [Algoriphagus pacificus]|uniref:Four helix bundle protein n=1 Tax=Algoriphagus pacificus TaxID=2811234 RepID=A0ABS3CKA9_9BACT|nr:four helix bundle protein [Algoriphagus pacificus]MBN7817536.1 four helix bundle protein [Algoriphagus pacificus]
MPNQIVDKSFFFAQRSLDFYLHLKSKGHFRLADQFVGASTSIGANVEEAQAAHSKADFIAKIIIAAKEARETKYWLKLLDRKEFIENEEEFTFLKNEIEELIKILNSIVISSRKNLKK